MGTHQNKILGTFRILHNADSAADYKYTLLSLIKTSFELLIDSRDILNTSINNKSINNLLDSLETISGNSMTIETTSLKKRRDKYEKISLVIKYFGHKAFSQYEGHYIEIKINLMFAGPSVLTSTPLAPGSYVLHVAPEDINKVSAKECKGFGRVYALTT